MTFAELKTELLARGFDHLSGREGQIINDAVDELDEMYQWPYREASVTGSAPLVIADLGTIEQVIDLDQNSQPLLPRTYQWLVATFGDVSISGPPCYFYVAWPSGTPEVATYPTNSNEIGVQYWKITPELSGDSDTPLAPARFHQIYLKIAQRMAEAERGNVNAVSALQGEIDRMTGRMVDALCGGQQMQGPNDLTRVWAAEDS